MDPKYPKIPPLLGTLFCLIALSGCLQTKTSRSIRPAQFGDACAIRAAAKSDASCEDLSRYAFDATHFAPDVQDGRESSEFCVGNSCATVSEISFSTESAFQNDPAAADHPEAYRYSDFRASLSNDNGGSRFSVSSDRSLEEAFEKAVQKCKESP